MPNSKIAALQEIDKVAGQVQTVLVTRMQKKIEVMNYKKEKAISVNKHECFTFFFLSSFYLLYFF